MILGAVLTLGIAPGHANRLGDGQPDAAPSAIATVVHGRVEVRHRSDAVRPLMRFDRLRSGDAVVTAADSTVTLAFRSGARVRIDGDSRVRVDTDGVTRVAGTVTSLTRVPVVPLVAPVSGADRVVAAVRVRAGGLVVRAPDGGMTTLAEATRLVFDPMAADGYDVEVEDRAARIVWRGRVPGSPAMVPAGLLEPGQPYRWRVRAQGPAGFVVEGQGAFSTLAAAHAQARADLQAAPVADDPAWPAVLAEIDFSLGLWTEALEAFHRLRDQGAADAVVLDRIATLERRLAAPEPQER